MSKHRKPQKRLDPDDVLEGRARPDARELCALIHEVNPSGHERLPARETARRYAQKSRLQSLLIHRFGEELIVEPTEDEGVVGLRHRASRADACHAVLASLDDDARSWAQRQIDLGGEDAPSVPSVHPVEEQVEGPPSDAALDDLSTGEVIRRGHEALDAYDYPLARERFAAAFERGSREAGVLLLTVLAEHLGLDDDALALEERLDEETLAGPEARLLLAQAAARTYQRERAVRLARRDTGEAAAHVFVALCRGALERGELEQAFGDVAEVQRRDPAHPALLGLTDTVKQRRAGERAPLEAEARGLLDEGRFEEAEAKAAALAARWPESMVARAIMRACEEERRRVEARALAREGSAAVEAGEGARALGLLRRAIALGLSEEDAARAAQDVARAEALEEALRAKIDAVSVARDLQGGHTLRALTGYLALPDGLRNALLNNLQRVELAYAEQTEIRGAGPEAKAAAQAVVALMRAANAEPASAIELLLPHMHILAKVPDAVTILDAKQQTETLRRQADAMTRHSAAMSAFDGTHEGLERHLRLMSLVPRDDLPDSSRTIYNDQLVRAERIRDQLRRSKEIGKLRKAGQLAAARDVVDQAIRADEAYRHLVEEDDGRIDWHRIRAEIDRDLAKMAGIRVHGRPARDAMLGVEAPALHDVPELLLPGGNELLLAELLADRVLLQIVDVASGAVTRRATLRMRLGFVVRQVQQSGDRALLLGSDGTYMQIDPRSWTLGTAIRVSDGKLHACRSVVAPGGRFVWTLRAIDGWWTALNVYDLRRDVHARTASESVLQMTVRPLFGLDPPRVVTVQDRGRVAVFEARGAPSGPAQDGVPMLPRSVVMNPAGKGLFGLLREGEVIGRMRWAELTPDGAPVAAPQGEDRTLATLDPDAPCVSAVALDAQIVFVLGTARDGARRLVAFVAREGSLARGFDVEVPPRVTLATDAGSRTVVALSPHEEGIEVVPLGAAPPVFRAAPPPSRPLDLGAVNLAPCRACAPRETKLWSVDGGTEGAHMSLAYLQHITGDDRRAMIESALGPEDRALVVPRYAALWEVPKPDFAEHFAAAAQARWPGEVELEQIPAQRAALAGDWAAVRDRLGPIDPSSLADAPAQHHDHLLGMALLMTGDADEARRVLARGAARTSGWCDLSVPLALAGLPSPCTGVALLADAVRAADACLAAGDLRGARMALSSLVVREAREVQALARLCRAWLQEPDETEPGGDQVDGFARRFALACFLTAHAEKAPARRRELPIPGARWDTATLDALAVEAKAWLDRDIQRQL